MEDEGTNGQQGKIDHGWERVLIEVIVDGHKVVMWQRTPIEELGEVPEGFIGYTGHIRGEWIVPITEKHSVKISEIDFPIPGNSAKEAIGHYNAAKEAGIMMAKEKAKESALQQMLLGKIQ